MLIPDISGFTNFVSDTEIIHGVHIIAELLEAIIESNSMGLQIAEIEGDAVFFYRIGEKPSLKILYEQCRKMYLAFHNRVQLYQRDRICDCGSCSGMHNLKLKFVSHYGRVVERVIFNHFQLMGADVTRVHKLLKNNIDSDEYLLFTENSVIKNEQDDIPEWFEVITESMNYEGMGVIGFNYALLNPLHKEIPILSPRKKVELIKKPLVFSMLFNTSIEKLYSIITDTGRKAEWMQGLKKVKFRENRVKRVGLRHDCVLPMNVLHFESVENTIEQEEMVYTEYAEDSGLLPAFYQRFVLKKITENQCNLRVEIHYKGSFLQVTMLRLSMNNVIKASLKKLKKIAE